MKDDTSRECNKALNSLHKKILHSKFAAEVTETEIEALVEAKSNGWIPCSERLPTEDREYEVTIDKRCYGKPTIRKTAYRYYDKGFWFSFDEVIAWREKTAPYKEGE